MKKIRMSILLAMVVFLLGVTNASAAWYQCKIAGITNTTDELVNVNLEPGTGETRFTERGRARIFLSDPGAKGMLATLLTAVSLNMEIKVSLDTAPSVTNQDILGLNLVVIP